MGQKLRTSVVIAGLSLLLLGVSYGQSLGDAARQQRQNQQAKKDQATPKVITNEDLPERASTEEDSQTVAPGEEPAPRLSTKSARQWRSEIEAKKRSIEMQQRQMERIGATIHYVQANRYYNGVQHNERQEIKQEQVQRLQEEIELHKQQLQDMQEAARKDGYGNAVYEP